MKATVVHEFEGCFSGCPYCSEESMGPNSCTHPAFAGASRRIVGYSSSTNEIPLGKKHPVWCPAVAFDEDIRGTLKEMLWELVRPEIRRLAHHMEIKFRRHASNGDPFDCNELAYLLKRQDDELRELTNAMGIGPDNFEPKPPSEVWEEAADHCNFILMMPVAYEKEWRKGRR